MVAREEKNICQTTAEEEKVRIFHTRNERAVPRVEEKNFFSFFSSDFSELPSTDRILLLSAFVVVPMAWLEFFFHRFSLQQRITLLRISPRSPLCRLVHPSRAEKRKCEIYNTQRFFKLVEFSPNYSASTLIAAAREPTTESVEENGNLFHLPESRRAGPMLGRS